MVCTREINELAKEKNNAYVRHRNIRNIEEHEKKKEVRNRVNIEIGNLE